MPSSTAVTLQINGVDRTRAVFASLQMRMQALGARVRRDAASFVGGLRIVRSGISAITGVASGVLSSIRSGILGVTAAVGALTAATIGAAKSFSALGDRAAQAGTTADELDRLAATLSSAGVRNANIDTIADAFARMAKTTGATGLAGFRETLATIAGMGDEADRVRELSRIFGRTFGPGLAATVRQGPDAFREGLDGVMGALSTVSDKAVEAGDAIADGFDFAKRGVLRSIQTVLVDAATRAFGKVGLSARAAGALVAGYAEVYASVVMRNLGPLWDRVKAAVLNAPRLVKASLKLILADVADFVSAAGQWLGLLLTGLTVLYASVGNVVGALAVGAAGGALAYGLSELEGAGRKARAEAERTKAEIDEIFAGSRPFDFGLTEAEQKRLDEVKKKASVDASMAKLVSGAASAAGDEIEESLGGAIRSTLGPLRSAAAVAANTYEAYKIGAAASANNNSPVDRAALDTAKNTGRMVQSLDQLSRTARDAYSAFQGLPPVYVL